ncbi:hypothetical protein HDU67_005126 [Dinochytrium kinnereticum]|nr:hypothetical protein HDU67_005126 [Dinochytrium kinnereticum]
MPVPGQQPRILLRLILFPLRHPHATASSTPTTASTPLLSTAPPPLFWFCHIPKESHQAIEEVSSATGGRWASEARRHARNVSSWVKVQWDGMGEKPEGSWQRKLHGFGNAVLDGIDAEEYFLKDVPSILIKPTVEASITVHHPTHIPSDQALSHLQYVSHHRINYHRRWLLISTLSLPFSAAATLLPGPNVFLLYNVVRLNDHYRALRGGQALERYIKSGRIVAEPDVRLDTALDKWTEAGEETSVPADIVGMVAETAGGAEGGLEGSMVRAAKQMASKDKKKVWYWPW